MIEEHTPPSYLDYEPLVRRFNHYYHMDWGVVSELQVPFTKRELRLVYLSLMASKAHLKEYDPKKGLNQ